MRTIEPKATTPKLSPRRRRLQNKREYVFSRLFQLGLSVLELAHLEANYLPSILHMSEEIGGVIAGQSQNGHIMIVATDKRVIVLDCMPGFTDNENIDYTIIVGVALVHAGPFYTVILKTHIGDYRVYTLRSKAVKSFKEYVDSKCFKLVKGGDIR